MRAAGRRPALWALLLFVLAPAAFADPRPIRIGLPPSNSETVAAYLRLVAQHNERPGAIRAEVRPLPAQGLPVSEQTSRALSWGNPALDLYIVNVSQVREFAERGLLAPVEPARGHFVGLAPAVLDDVTVDDTLWAIPAGLGMNLLYYDAVLLERQGIAPPRSLPELVEAANRLMDRGAVRQGLIVGPDTLPGLLTSAGGSPYDEGSDAAAQAEVFRLLAEGSRPGLPVHRMGQIAAWEAEFPSEEHSVAWLFEHDLVAFVTTFHQSASLLDRAGLAGEVGVAPLPGLVPGAGRCENDTYYYVVGAHSDRIDDSIALALWLGGTEVARERASSGRLSVWPDLVEALPEGTVVSRVGGLLDRLSPRTTSPAHRSLGPELLRELDTVVDGSATPEAAVSRFAATRARAEALARPASRASLPTYPIRVAALSGLPTGPMIAALWLAVALVGGGLLVVARRRGGLFTSLSGRLATLTATVVLLALTSTTSLLLRRSAQVSETNLANRDRALIDGLGQAALAAGRHLALAVSAVPPGPEQRATLVSLLAEAVLDRDLMFIQLLDAEGRVLADDDSMARAAWPDLDLPADAVPDDETRQLVVEGAARIRHVPADPACEPGRCELGRIEAFLPMVPRGAEGLLPLETARALRLGFSVRRLRTDIDALLSAEQDRFDELVWIANVATALLVLAAALTLIFISRWTTRDLVALRRRADRIGAGELDVSAAPRGRDEVAVLGQAFNDMVLGLQQRDFIERTFKRFVAPSVVEELVSTRQLAVPGGQARPIAIFFSDIAGFTSIAEALPPATLTRLLNDYLGAMTEIIHDSGGTVDKYVGDAVVAFWGAPVSQADAAARALRAAVDQQAAVARLARAWQEAGHPLSVRMGIHHGVATVGSFGSPERMDYTAIGDAVNLAARLEGVNKLYGTRILASEQAVEAAGPGHAVRELDEVAVKGRGAPVRIFEVLSTPRPPGAVLEAYAVALRAWRLGDLPGALAALEAAGAEDGPSRALAARVREQLARSDPSGWSPVRVLTEK